MGVDVSDNFAGWSHLHDLGKATTRTQHPGDPPAAGTQLTAALLPSEPAERYEALKAIVGDRGGTWKSGKGEVNLVGIQDLQDLCYRSPNRGGWNDTLFACFVDQDGNKLSLELRASLNPGHDEDPKGAWNLSSGSYAFKLKDGEGGSKVLVPEGKIKGWCDKPGRGAPPPQEGPPQPGDALCTPRLRLLPQWDERWTGEILHSDKGHTWGNSGCHPSSVAAVLRWIAEDNPATAGKFKFPTAPSSGIPEDQYPRRMCEAFWPDLGGRVESVPSKSDPSVDHTALRTAAEKALGMPEGAAKLKLESKDRLGQVKKALAKGPLLVCMPGHYVCIQGIADGNLLIVDPGNVLVSYWAIAGGGDKPTPITQAKGMPDTKTGWRGSAAPKQEGTKAAYVSIPLDAKLYTPEPDPSDKKYDKKLKHWNKSDYKTADKAKRFLDTITKPESYWWAGGE